ncbi:hypothetical protein GJ496_005566 [Pomphorhynchus laevis]|nr:hypothetical protein GJ496_005566 [Pomphorhynchus laevis]
MSYHKGSNHYDPSSNEEEQSNKRMQSMYPLPSSLRANAKLKGSELNVRHKNEEEYFNSDGEDGEEKIVDESELEYQPAPGSPNANDKSNASSDDSEEDPLDSYMNQVNAEAEKDLKNIGSGKLKSAKRQDIDEADDQETFYQWLEENPDAGVSLQVEEDDEDREIDYDDNGNIIAPEKSKWIDPLPEIDHSSMDYKPFNKNFYTEHEDISALKNEHVAELRIKLNIKATGYDVPRPVASFAHFGFDKQLMTIIQRQDFTQPSPIQSQAIPAVLSGRDVIGIGKTGSGKTCAFVWPALIHIMDQPNLDVDDGPIVLILVPTRELAQQIQVEGRKFAKAYNIQVGCAYGGSNLHEQMQSCRNGTCEILVSTPGRLIDMVKKKSVSLSRVTFIVLDEADRLFDMGFEPQVRSIVNHIRPDRQCLLFSATFRKKVDKLCRDVLCDPIRITHSDGGDANENITQIVEVLQSGSEKWTWLVRRIEQFTSHGKLLIFVTKRDNCETLAKNLKEHKHVVRMIHGEIPQYERDQAVQDFRTSISILVATDVASRGLDIKSIKTVLNYDVARDITTHIHRIGRTARAGEQGFAFTLVTPKDKEFIPHLVRNLEQNNQYVPPELVKLAHSIPWFSESRPATNTAKKLTVGGAGLGYKERPSQHAIGPMSDYRGINIAGKHVTGPQGNRVTALKSAFQSQFRSNFVAAQSDPDVISKTISSSSQKRSCDSNQSKARRKKSRFTD